MTAYTFSNLGESTLSSSVDTSVTTWTVADGSVFPAGGDFFVRADRELALCTSISGNDLTVTRNSGAGGTLASHASGAAVKEVATAEVFEAFAQLSRLSASRNVLRNSGFAVAQRQPGTESTDTTYADDAYCTCDGWYVLTQTASIQTSRQAGSGRSRYRLRLKQTQASAQRMGAAMIVEAQDGYDLCDGSTLNRFSIKIECSSAQAIRYAILGNTGTADAAPSDVVSSWTSGTFTAGNFFLGSGLEVVAVGATTPSAATPTAVVLTGTPSASCKNLIVFVWTEGTAAQNVTLAIEEASLSGAYDGRIWTPPPVDLDLLRCYRYFQRIRGPGSNLYLYGARQSTIYIRFMLPLRCRMRAAATAANSAPTWTSGGPGTNNQIGAFNFSADANVTISGSLTTTATAQDDRADVVLQAGGSFSGTAGQVVAVSIGSGAYFDFPAEL